MSPLRHLHPLPEEEMAATFLRPELASYRFELPILAILERNGRDRASRQKVNLHPCPGLEVTVISPP